MHNQHLQNNNKQRARWEGTRTQRWRVKVSIKKHKGRREGWGLGSTTNRVAPLQVGDGRHKKVANQDTLHESYEPVEILHPTTTTNKQDFGAQGWFSEQHHSNTDILATPSTQHRGMSTQGVERRLHDRNSLHKEQGEKAHKTTKPKTISTQTREVAFFECKKRRIRLTTR